MKLFPINRKVYITDDSESFVNRNFSFETELPIKDHVGAFSTKRKNHCHEGVDLYCEEGTSVYAVEDGEVVLIENFTGEHAPIPSPWWNNTNATHVEGESGVIVYGEIDAITYPIGHKIKQGDLVGYVKTVLKKDKGRPMTMLHFELYEHGSRASVEWHPWQDNPPQFLKNPTQLLIQAAKDSEVLQNGETFNIS
jgi:murein DD-endopeptidase MepM/ murein hydrolase activator NlpD